MGYNVQDHSLGTIVAAADLSAKRYYAVAIGSSGWDVPSAAGAKCSGILQDTPTAGQACSVQVGAVSPAKFGGTIAIGARVSALATGKIQTAQPGDYVLGRALVAGVDGDEGTILITNEGYGSVVPLSFHFNLADIANGDLVTNLALGFAGRIVGLYAVVTKAASTAAKAATLNMEVGTTNLTGGSLALTSANMTPIGAVVAATAITAGNAFTAAENISLEAASVTAFIEGEIDVVVLIAQPA